MQLGDRAGRVKAFPQMGRRFERKGETRCIILCPPKVEVRHRMPGDGRPGDGRELRPARRCRAPVVHVELEPDAQPGRREGNANQLLAGQHPDLQRRERLRIQACLVGPGSHERSERASEKVEYFRMSTTDD